MKDTEKFSLESFIYSRDNSLDYSQLFSFAEDSGKYFSKSFISHFVSSELCHHSSKFQLSTFSTPMSQKADSHRFSTIHFNEKSFDLLNSLNFQDSSLTIQHLSSSHYVSQQTENIFEAASSHSHPQSAKSIFSFLVSESKTSHHPIQMNNDPKNKKSKLPIIIGIIVGIIALILLALLIIILVIKNKNQRKEKSEIEVNVIENNINSNTNTNTGVVPLNENNSSDDDDDIRFWL